MRLTLYLLLLTMFQAVAGNSYSQNTRLSIKLSNAKVKEVLNEIEEKSEFYFMFNSKLVDVERRVDINASDQQIDKILTILFAGYNVGYTVMNRQIIIQPQNSLEENAVQQSKTVSGKISDSSGASLPGVSIVVKGTTTGTITDSNGHFLLSGIPENATLIFTFVGMKTQEIVVGNQSTINVTLFEETHGIDEVVVVGYGTQKKVTSTGSIVSTGGEQLVKSPATNLTHTLMGLLPGLSAITNGGEPGNDNATLRIRGSNTLGDNSPLVIVDGVPNRGLARIESSDIQSITILKDASAAIYGSQASNGVILVTTKRGGMGKPKITMSMNNGYSQPTRTPKMANAAQYATLLNEVAYYGTPSLGRNQKYSETDIQQFADGSDPWGHPNTDWIKAVLKPWSNQNHQTVSISGGNENMKYFLSLGARFEDGFYRNSASNYKQYNFRSNIDGKISKNISISFDVAGTQAKTTSPHPPLNKGKGELWRAMGHFKPTQPAYWPNGTPGPDIELGINPVVTVTDATGYLTDNNYVFESNLRTVISIPWVSGLSITGNAAIDKSFDFNKSFGKPWYLYSWDGNADHITTPGKRGFDAPELSEDMSIGQNISLNAYITYERTIAEKHGVKIMAGTERRNGNTDVFSAFRKNFISSNIDQLFAGASDEYMSNDGYAYQNAYMSYFGRLNYDFSKKYILEFVWRYDGSYKFPESKRFGFFPGISAGWRLSEETFWKQNLAAINDFKLRASWGQTGNDRIADYQYLATYGFDQNKTYVFGAQDNKILYETKIPNPNVTWEVANQTNLGFDAIFLNNRISVSADYFNYLRSQILIKRNASIPNSTGLSLPPENIGKVRNSGFEAVIGYSNHENEIKYDLSINGSYSKNKIIFWDETPGIPDYQRSTGMPMGASLYYQAIGIFKDQASIDAYPHWPGARPGDVIFKDVYVDGKIDGLDRVRNDKTTMPRFIGGLTINLKYKDFDLSTLLQGAMGGQQYVQAESGEIGNYYEDFVIHRWTPENINASYPRAYNRADQYWGNNSNSNTFWLRSTDYVRLKNFELGYSLPSTLNKTLAIEKLRVYINGLNLFTLDKAKIIDPESLYGSGQSYPLQRVVNLGLTLTF